MMSEGVSVQYVTAALAVCVLTLSACSGAGAAATPSNSPAATPQPTATPSNSLTPTPVPPTASPISTAVDPEKARQIVAFLDALPTADDRVQAILDQAEWQRENIYTIAVGDLEDYIVAFLNLQLDLVDGTASDGDIEEVLSYRDTIAAIVPGGVEAPEPTAEPTPKPTPKPAKVDYKRLSDRSWAKLVKNPDNNTGKAYEIWGCIFQFDAATGTDAFLAQASNKKQEYWFSDGENAAFVGTDDKLADFVEDDVVQMKVISLGSYSYDTQAGGNTTVPKFEVRKITHKGSCD